MPSRALHLQTPLDCLKELHPATCLTYEVPLSVFGCTAYVHSFGPKQIKFTHRAPACVGYPLHQRGYKCFLPLSCKYFIIMDVIFREDRPFFPVSFLQGENVSEESNCSLEFTRPTSVTLPDLDPHPERIRLINRLQSKTLNLHEIKVWLILLTHRLTVK